MIGLMLMAAAATLPFAPPVDHPLNYETVETRGAHRYTLEQDVGFARDGTGWTMTVTPVSWKGGDDPAADRKAALTANAIIGVPLHIRLAADGTPTAVIDGEPNWRALLKGLQAVAALPDATEAQRRAAADFAMLPPDARDAQLLVAANDILPVDGSGHREQTVPQPNGGMLRIVEDVEVSPQSGLVVHRHRSLSGSTGGGAAPVAIGDSDVRLVGY